MQQVSISQLAEALNLSERWVQQLASQGMPKSQRGRYPLEECLRWYIRYLQRAAERHETLTGRAANDVVKRERARLLQAQAARAERRNLIESGQVVPLDLMRARLSTAIVTARQNLLQLPGRVAPQLEGEPRLVIKEKLRAEVYAALAALAVNGNGTPPEPMGGDDCSLTTPVSEVSAHP
jgi:phage terminase Nu1 subunit (DNA packaging protein)